MSKAIRYVETDENGSFLIDRLVYGTYIVEGEKEEDGYPSSIFSLDAGKLPAAVTISPEQPDGIIVLKLGPRAGVLKGTVRDAVTGKKIGTNFTVRRWGTPGRFFSTSEGPQFRLLIPASTDVTLEVTAPGYKKWFFAAQSHPSRPAPLRLESGAQMHMDILLQPSHDRNGLVRKYLVPEGYVGWLRLECNVNDAPPVRRDGLTAIYEFPQEGVLRTSSALPEIGAKSEYFFYSADGSVRPIPSDYWKGAGLVWGEYEGSRSGTRSFLGFFVGTEEQYAAHRNPPL